MNCCCMTVPQTFTSQAFHNLMCLYLILLSMIPSQQGLSLGVIFNDWYLPFHAVSTIGFFSHNSLALRSSWICTLSGHIFFLLSLILPQIFHLIWNKQFWIAAWYHPPHLWYNTANKRANINAFFGTVSDAQHI